MDTDNKLDEILTKYLDNKLGPILAKHFNNVVEDNLAISKKKTSLAERVNESGGLLGVGFNYLKKRYTDNKEKNNTPTAVEQAGVGKAIKATEPVVPPLETPSQNLITPERLKTGEPATASNKEEKRLIKGEDNVVLIGGITPHGVEDLARKLPKAFKHVLEDLSKHLGKASTEEKKPNEPASGGGSGNGLLGTIWDFFKGRGGKKIAAKEAEELAAKEGGKLATKAVGKVVAKEGTEIAAKEGGKLITSAVAKEGTEIAAKEGTEIAAKEGTEIAAKEGGKLVTSAVGKEGAEIAAKEGTEVAAKAGGKAGGKLVAEEGAKVGGKVLAKEGVKIGGKALGKSLLKKIPLIGAVAGLGFGAQRALHGDWLGAAGEVASGAASTIPGLGTAASLGIDAALAGRDIYKASKGEGEGGATPEVTGAPAPTEAGAAPVADIAAAPPAVQPAEPSVQPAAVIAPPPPSPTTPDHGDILGDISANTGKTNDLISSLTQAIMKLAQNAGNNNSGPNIVMGGSEPPKQASAADMMANNSDPIRAVRSKYTS